MYLTLLSEEEKELFLGIAYNLAYADGDYSDEEKAMIAGYCQEMQMEFVQEKALKPIDTIIERVKMISCQQSKKIILFEAIGLAMSDGNYDATERALVEKMEKAFGTETGFINKCESILSEYISFQNKIGQLILE